MSGKVRFGLVAALEVPPVQLLLVAVLLVVRLLPVVVPLVVRPLPVVVPLVVRPLVDIPLVDIPLVDIPQVVVLVVMPAVHMMGKPRHLLVLSDHRLHTVPPSVAALVVVVVVRVVHKPGITLHRLG